MKDESWRRRTCISSAAILLLITLAFAGRASAGLYTFIGEDRKALMEYRLTLDKVSRFNETNKKIAVALRADPQLRKESEATGRGFVRPGMTIDEMAAEFGRRCPRTAAMFADEGFTVREYMLCTLATMYASAGADRSISTFGQVGSDFFTPDNVKLAEENPQLFKEVREVREEMGTK